MVFEVVVEELVKDEGEVDVLDWIVDEVEDFVIAMLH